jgi:hypothetical protein
VLQAVLNGRPLARNTSSAVSGEALLNINLQQPPGTYRLVFEVMSMNDINTDMSVTVEKCGPGEVNVTGALKVQGQSRRCVNQAVASYSQQRDATHQLSAAFLRFLASSQQGAQLERQNRHCAHHHTGS